MQNPPHSLLPSAPRNGGNDDIRPCYLSYKLAVYSLLQQASPVKNNFLFQQTTISPPEARAEVTTVCVVHNDAQHISRRPVQEALPEAHDVRVG